MDRALRIHFTLLDPIPAIKAEALDGNRTGLFLLHFRRMARQRLGQHFLADADWREQIARAIGVSPHSTLRSEPALDQSYCWIEIGAGHGEMTEHLASTGAAVYAIELDELLLGRLRRLAKKFPNVTVVQGDVLETDLAALAAGRRIRLYGNLPYYITSPILHHFFAFANLIDEIHIVIQEEVAHRLAAKPGTKQYGYLSAVAQLYTRPEFVLRIPRSAFSPPPEVGSGLVTLRLPGERAKLALRDEAAFLEFVKLCFSQKRKTLVNNLRALASPDDVRKILAAQNLRSDARAEQLTVAQFAAIETCLNDTDTR
jgi:16S rRNA (adenine1518-N6/adenine1519-N6)-dimethyltransferase